MPKLNNNKMAKLVANLLGKSELTVSGGKVELTDAEKEKVRSQYGASFLSALEATDFEADAEAANTLFDAAVAAKTAEATKALSDQVAKLQADIVALANEPEKAPSAAKAPVAAAPAAKVNMSHAHNAEAARILANPQNFANMTATINVADLNSEFSMVMPPKQRLELITKRLYMGFDDAQHMTRVQSNTDYIASQAIMGEVSQAFTPFWTPKGTASFTPCRIPYRRHKINVSIKPADVLSSWLMYLYEQGLTPAQQPITRYIIEEHIVPKCLEDITLSMIGKGKYTAPASTITDGSAGLAAKDSMDGYETILVQGKTKSSCKFNFYKNAVNPYTLTDQQLLDYVNNFVSALAPQFAGRLEVHCAQELVDKYNKADFAINGKYTGMQVDGKVRFSQFELIPLKSMYNSQIIFATPKENFVELVDMSSADRCINKINEHDYDIHIIGEYSLSVGFKVQEAVFAAVPAGYVPYSKIATGVSDYNDKWQNGSSGSGAGSGSSAGSGSGSGSGSGEGA